MLLLQWLPPLRLLLQDRNLNGAVALLRSCIHAIMKKVAGAATVISTHQKPRCRMLSAGFRARPSLNACACSAPKHTTTCQQCQLDVAL